MVTIKTHARMVILLNKEMMAIITMVVVMAMTIYTLVVKEIFMEIILLTLEIPTIPEVNIMILEIPSTLVQSMTPIVMEITTIMIFVQT